MTEKTPSYQYSNLEQQTDASTLGMWTFLGTEVLFFGALIAAYFNYRIYYGQEWIDAASNTKWVLGTVNTGVLLTSSGCIAMAVHSAEDRAPKSAVPWLLATVLLGFIFIGIKGLEYFEEYREHLVPALNFDVIRYGGVNAIFFTWYFCATGLHALHLAIGIIIAIVATLLIARERAPGGMSLRIIALYWHFVDVVWIFLFPLIYLAGRNG